jgi:hypothetical protein
MTADVGVSARDKIRELLTRYQFTGETVGTGIVALMQSARFSMHHTTPAVRRTSWYGRRSPIRHRACNDLVLPNNSLPEKGCR